VVLRLFLVAHQQWRDHDAPPALGFHCEALFQATVGSAKRSYACSHTMNGYYGADHIHAQVCSPLLVEVVASWLFDL
jgi:hypothetical protein